MTCENPKVNTKQNSKAYGNTQNVQINFELQLIQLIISETTIDQEISTVLVFNQAKINFILTFISIIQVMDVFSQIESKLFSFLFNNIHVN